MFINFMIKENGNDFLTVKQTTDDTFSFDGLIDEL